MDWRTFCNKLNVILGPLRRYCELNDAEDALFLESPSQEVVSEFTKQDFEAWQSNAESYDFQQFSISNENSFEMLIEPTNSNIRRELLFNFEDRLEEFSVFDNDANLEYFFQKASNEIIWYILDLYDAKRRIPTRMPMSMYEIRWDNTSDKNIFSLIKLAVRLPISIKIINHSVLSREEQQKRLHSFLFNFAFNYNIAFKPISELNEIFPQRNLLDRKYGLKFDELMAPQLTYNQELVEQYYMALSSDDPFIEFIGYYHIMEHFYEDVYNEDIYNNIQSLLQHPGFSAKRKKDIAKLVDVIHKKLSANKTEFQGNELEALELTLIKFVDVDDLQNKLADYGKDLIDYYKTHELSFSKGDTVDLNDKTNDKLFKKIAARIYKTRNALVHSKSNENKIKERGVYKPFKDNLELLKEIPLMKCIAESIIIGSAVAF